MRKSRCRRATLASDPASVREYDGESDCASDTGFMFGSDMAPDRDVGSNSDPDPDSDSHSDSDSKDVSDMVSDMVSDGG